MNKNQVQTVREQMEKARALIRAKEYDKARVVLQGVDHPKAREWLGKLPPSNARKRRTQLSPAMRTEVVQVTKSREGTLYRESPAMFRNKPILFLILLFSGIGWPFLFFWWLNARNAVLIISSELVTLRHGILSRHTNELFLTDVRNVKVSQSLFQRMMGTGVIEISTASASADDIVVSGLPNPQKIKSIIHEARR